MIHKYILPLLLLLAAGCTKTQPTTPEPWISQSPEKWPQMVLTNEAHFNGHTSLYGASSFLVINDNEKVFAATARHLIGENGGVEPEIEHYKLDKVIKTWQMYPRTKQTETVQITNSIRIGTFNQNLDWLILNIRDDQKSKYPSLPLKIRKDPVEVGEEVFLVGVPYSDTKSSQNIYKGIVTKRAYDDRFKYSLDPPVDIRGFSGAPILDKNGYAVGVMTVWFDPKMDGDNYLEAGGEDIASIQYFINRIK